MKKEMAIKDLTKDQMIDLLESIIDRALAIKNSFKKSIENAEVEHKDILESVLCSSHEDMPVFGRYEQIIIDSYFENLVKCKILDLILKPFYGMGLNREMPTCEEMCVLGNDVPSCPSCESNLSLKNMKKEKKYDD